MIHAARVLSEDSPAVPAGRLAVEQGRTNLVARGHSLSTSKESQPNYTKQGCLVIIIASLAISMCITFWPEGESDTCKLMRTIDYNYQRVHQLTDANLLDLRLIQYHWGSVTPYNEGLRLYCTDPDAFWGSRYDEYSD